MSLSLKYKKAGGGCKITQNMLDLLEEQYPPHVPVNISTIVNYHNPFCSVEYFPGLGMNFIITLGLSRTLRDWKKSFKRFSLTNKTLKTSIEFSVVHEYAHLLNFQDTVCKSTSLVFVESALIQFEINRFSVENEADEFAKKFLGLSYVRSRYVTTC